jgi:hypothetical protein
MIWPAYHGTLVSVLVILITGVSFYACAYWAWFEMKMRRLRPKRDIGRRF